jgi:hypothetical protein
MIGPRLRAYLRLEREMLMLDDLGDDLTADLLRDAMDPLWYALSDDERAWLDVRMVVPSSEVIASYERLLTGLRTPQVHRQETLGEIAPLVPEAPTERERWSFSPSLKIADESPGSHP